MRRSLDSYGAEFSIATSLQRSAVCFTGIVLATFLGAFPAAFFSNVVNAQDRLASHLASSERPTSPSTPRQRSAKNEAVEFETGIMPLFSKFGCNAAECHGSATGQGDFKLSLFGGDPDQDYVAVVEQLEGRRINLAAPDKSLLITKPSEMLSHGGGEIFEADSVAVQRILNWISAGANRESKTQIEDIQIAPAEIVSKGVAPVQLKITAQTNLGNRVVTGDTTFYSNNPSAVSVTPQGKITIRKPGKYFVIAKYLNFSKAISVIKPFEDQTQTRLDYEQNSIDRLVSQSLQELNLSATPAVDDLKFVRRLVLDLTGRLPTKDQAIAYRDSRDARKKEKLIRKLLASAEFESYWAYWLRRTLQFRVIGTNAAERKRGELFNHWLRSRVKTDKPWDETVAELVTAVGDSDKVPAVNYHRFFQDPRLEAESVAQAFLGIRIECANCHNHPLDRWTQEDYHGLAAIFATLKRGPVIAEMPSGKVVQPKTGKPAIPRIPGEFDLAASENHRKRLANWISANRLFRETTINRVWAHFMGRGIVEPLDDFRASNPAVDRPLLTALGNQFAKNGFRLKPMIQAIVSSEVYASEPFARKHSQFVAGYHSKELTPEVLLDISAQVIYAEPEKSLAIEALEPHRHDPSLALLKSCSPRGPCIFNSAGPEFGLREKLHFINGDFFNLRLDDPGNWIYTSYDRDRSAIKVIEGLYWRALSRPMTKKENRFWQAELSEQPAGRVRQLKFLEDVAWSLMNSREFTSIR